MIGLKEIKEILQPNDSRLSWIKNFRLPFTKPKITVSENDEKNDKPEEQSLENSEKTKYISDFATP